MGRSANWVSSKWAGASAGARLAVLGNGILVLSLVVVLLLSIKPSHYQVLYAGLDRQDSAAISSRLVETGVPFRVRNHGAVILAPSTEIARARNDVAGQGLVKVHDDKITIPKGATPDTVAVLRLQALDQRLADGVGQLLGGTRCLVRVSLAGGGHPASASVLLEGTGKSAVDEKQIRSIVGYLVTTVAQLDAEDVTVLAEDGGKLSKVYPVPMDGKEPKR